MIIGEDLRPDMVICDNSGKWYVLDLTCCYETIFRKAYREKNKNTTS